MFGPSLAGFVTLFITYQFIIMAAWTLPGLGVKFGPSRFFFFNFCYFFILLLFFKVCIFFFLVIDRIFLFVCLFIFFLLLFFFWWMGLINKSCVSVMAVLKFLLCLCLIFFFNLCKLKLLKTCYYSVKLQQYFL